MPSCGIHRQAVQRSQASCDRARNEQQKSILLNELAKLQTTRAAELNAQSATLLQQSASVVKRLKRASDGFSIRTLSHL
jgi:hypothetical protein